MGAGPYFLWESILSCGDEGVDLHVCYTVSVAVVDYFGTQVPEVEQIDGCVQIETMNVNDKELGDQKDQFAVSDVLLSESLVILTVGDLQVESCGDGKVLIEYALAGPMPFEDAVAVLLVMGWCT